MHKRSRLSICLFALSPPEEKRRRRVKESWWGRRRFCRAGERRERKRDGKKLNCWQRRGEAGNHMEEPSCDSRPTSMHRCECLERTLVSPATLPRSKQINPISHRILQKPSNFIQHFIQRLIFFCNTLPNYICYMSDCFKSPLVVKTSVNNIIVFCRQWFFQ